MYYSNMKAILEIDKPETPEETLAEEFNLVLDQLTVELPDNSKS